MSTKEDVRRALWIIAIICFFTCFFFQKIFWENFDSDGVEAFEFGRSLSNHILPNWQIELEHNIFGFYHNFFLFAYPIYWNIILFGPIEAAARLPFILYLPILFCVLVMLIEWKSSSRLNWKDEFVLLLALGIYTIVMGYNAAWDPYHADIAEPTGTDTLMILSFLGATYYFFVGRSALFWMFALLTSFSVSNGLLLLFMLGIFSWLLLTGKRRYIFTTIGFVIAVNVLLGILYEWWYVNAVVDRSKIYPELGMKQLLARFRYLDPFYFYRFAFLIFPCGIIPALSLIMVNWQDKIARIITCCTCSIFFLFYINGFIVLHYFVPTMILPLIVFWRIYLSKNDRFKRICLPLVFISTTVSLYLSLPESFEIDQTSREFGYATDYRIGNYNSDYWLAMKYAGVIHCAIQGDWLLEDPGHEWGTTPDRWIYYAMQPKPEENQINYIVQLEDKAPPEGYTLYGKEQEACFYVRDIERLLQYKYKENHVDYKSPLYEIPRSEMFYHLRIKEPLIDLKKIFRHTF